MSSKETSDLEKMPLPDQISGLITALGNATESIRRGKRNQNILIVLVVACIVMGIWLWNQNGNLNAAVDKADDAAHTAQVAAAAVKAQQTATCESSNESRSATDYVWDVIWTIFVNPSTSAKDRRNLRALNDFTDGVYAPRDCTDLTKKFVLPPKPILER